MNTTLKVSYTAMLKKLIQLVLCDESKYKYLRDYASKERAQELQELTKKEGYNTSLITPSMVTSIPTTYIENVKENYESEKISYTKLQQLFNYINLSPEEKGYNPPSEDDIVWIKKKQKKSMRKLIIT
jgi:hypothetical protein